MKINGNILPQKLKRLINEGLWVLPESQEDKVYLDVIHKGLRHLELYGISNMQIETLGLLEYCSKDPKIAKFFLGKPDERKSPGDIDFSKAIVIGDLGLGSDTPIALDYRKDKNNPSVVVLHWFRLDDKVQTRWLRIADSFDEFWQAICVRG